MKMYCTVQKVGRDSQRFHRKGMIRFKGDSYFDPHFNSIQHERAWKHHRAPHIEDNLMFLCITSNKPQFRDVHGSSRPSLLVSSGLAPGQRWPLMPRSRWGDGSGGTPPPAVQTGLRTRTRSTFLFSFGMKKLPASVPVFSLV